MAATIVTPQALETDPRFAIPLEQLFIPHAAKKVFAVAGLVFVGQVVPYTESRIISWRHCGVPTFNKIRQAIEDRLGLGFGLTVSGELMSGGEIDREKIHRILDTRRYDYRDFLAAGGKAAFAGRNYATGQIDTAPVTAANNPFDALMITLADLSNRRFAADMVASAPELGSAFLSGLDALYGMRTTYGKKGETYAMASRRRSTPALPFSTRLRERQQPDEAGLLPDDIVSHGINAYALCLLFAGSGSPDRLVQIASYGLTEDTSVSSASDIAFVPGAIDKVITSFDASPDLFKPEEAKAAKEFRELLIAMKSVTEQLVKTRDEIRREQGLRLVERPAATDRSSRVHADCAPAFALGSGGKGK